VDFSALRAVDVECFTRNHFPSYCFNLQAFAGGGVDPLNKYIATLTTVAVLGLGIPTENWSLPVSRHTSTFFASGLQLAYPLKNRRRACLTKSIKVRKGDNYNRSGNPHIPGV